MRYISLRLGVVACLFLFQLPGCGGDESSTSDTLESTIPATLRGFLMARGVPHIYSIAFADQALNDDGLATPAEEIRRIEAWTWLGDSSSRAVFDSGFLVEEEPVATSLATAPIPLRSPTDFHGDMTPDDIELMLGASDSDETGSLGGRSLRVLRFDGDEDEPPAAYGFVNGRLTSVVVGTAMVVQ